MTVINANSVMAMRAAILQKNSALNAAASGGDVSKIGGAGGAAGSAGGVNGGSSVDFGSAMKSALNQVNELQQKSSEAATAYEKGETTDIAAVMLAKQQASVGFEATLQVRNKLLSAYKDIMSMPV